MDIENTIKIMLKGAADHTDVEEIREKLKKVDAEHRPLRIKLGLDPSAPDIHLGHASPPSPANPPRWSGRAAATSAPSPAAPQWCPTGSKSGSPQSQATAFWTG